MTKASKKVIAIVVTFNRKELLKECIQALLAQDYENCDILIVDNASTDGTKDFIENELKQKKVHYINTGKNIGGAGGFNYGMKEAYKLGCDYMWLMDDDCIVEKDSLTKLIEADEELKGNYGFLSSKVLWKDGSLCVMNTPRKKIAKKIKNYNQNLQQIQISSFVSFFIKTEVVNQIGLPIKEFFIWGDDWEYSYRISKSYKNYYVTSSVVCHKSNSNNGSDISKEDQRLERFSYSYRNEYYIFSDSLKNKIFYLLKRTYHRIKILKSNKKNKRERLKIISEAIKKGKEFNPSIEYLRKEKNG